MQPLLWTEIGSQGISNENYYQKISFTIMVLYMFIVDILRR